MDDKRKYRDLSRAIKETDKEIDRLFDRAVRQVSALLTSSGADLSAVTDGALFLTLHPEIRDGIREIVSSLSADLLRSMQAGIVRGWELAEEHASATIAAYIGSTTPDIGETLRRALLDRRRGAVTPFLRSRLEERVQDSVWRTSEQARHHITDSVASALEEGLSADDLSRRIRQDLREPGRLFRRVRDRETGTLHLSKPARAYHPGQGVYRSSYKNAKRLARTEINIAYRTSDYERWQGKDFVLGFRIHLSGNHTCNGVPFSDICDDLEGVYPKTFKFTGWHPQCRCIATPILEDADHCFRRILTGEGEAPEAITDLPPQMDEWMRKNAARLRRADARGTTPYWVRDNFSKEGKGGNGGKPPKPPRHSLTAPDDRENNRQRFLSYDKETWEQTRFYPDTGGYVVRDRSRIERGTINKQERYKLEKETRMCHVFARAGHRIELLEEIPRIPSPDVTLDDIPADLKSLKGANNILREAKSATEKQGAKLVLYEFEKVDTKVIQALACLKSKGIPVMYYEKGVDEVIVP